MIRQYFLLKMKAKSTWFVIAILVFYISIAFFNVDILSLTSWEDSPSFFNANYASLFFNFGLTFLTIPLFYIFMLSNSIYFDKDHVFTRYGNIKKYWIARSVTILLECFSYIVFLYFLLFVRALYFQQSYKFFMNYGFLLKAAISQIVCFYVLAIIDCYTTFLLERPVVGFLFSYLLVVYDYASMQTHAFPEFFVFKAMAAKPEEMQNYLPNLIFIVAVAALVTFIYFVFAGKKDQLPRRENE